MNFLQHIILLFRFRVG